VSTPLKYSPAAVGRKILAEVIDQLPTLWAAHFLITERIVSDPKDKREVETAERALDNLQRSGLVQLNRDELVEPTDRAFGASRS
jgi:hypothetical protein